MLLGLGCAPSAQSAYEASVRFEHCYRLDLDPDIAPSHRRACWLDWSERHAATQPRDRRDYAAKRSVELAAGQRDGTPLDLSARAAAPPPLRAPQDDVGRERLPERRDPEPTTCENACGERWRECDARCDRPAGTGCGECDELRARCLAACFH